MTSAFFFYIITCQKQLGILHAKQQYDLPIIPVLSQHREKLYLSFMDEDSKGVEIVSKVALLAEDNILKDPTIMKWIKRE